MTSHAREVPLLIVGSPLIEQVEIDEVLACMRSAWRGIALPRVVLLERAFAEHQGIEASEVSAFNSCAAALHVSMVAANREPGAKVITTPMAIWASINAIIDAVHWRDPASAFRRNAV